MCMNLGPSWWKRVTLFLRMALRPIAGQGLLILEVYKSHATAHHSLEVSSGWVFSSSQRPLPDSTQHSQQTNIHSSVGIGTHNLSRRAATHLRPEPRGHCDWLSTFNSDYFEFPTPPAIYFVRFKYSETPTERQPLSSLMNVTQSKIAARTNSGAISGFVWILSQLHRKQEASYDERGESACFKCVQFRISAFSKDCLDFGSGPNEKNLEMFNYL